MNAMEFTDFITAVLFNMWCFLCGQQNMHIFIAINQKVQFEQVTISLTVFQRADFSEVVVPLLPMFLYFTFGDQFC